MTPTRMYLEPEVEPIFHPDSYGYRPGKSALDAVGACRVRCWRKDWVIDMDIRAFFDTVSHELVLEAVAKHVSADQRWILLYVQRWLTAAMQRQDGALVARDRGTPQGSAISPLLGNLFMHYAFDVWLVREFPTVTFERYCDDAVVHCGSRRQAEYVRDAIARRLAQVGLELHPDRTRIIYCKDADRTGSYEHIRFTFLGYEFRPRLVKNKHGKHFVSFLPAVSTQAMGAVIRSWHLSRRSDKSLDDLARMFNSIVQGWINYYGRFYRSRLLSFLRHLNKLLAGWACRKYKRLKRRERRAMAWLAEISRRSPRLFAHWRLGARPDGWAMGAGQAERFSPVLREAGGAIPPAYSPGRALHHRAPGPPGPGCVAGADGGGRARPAPGQTTIVYCKDANRGRQCGTTQYYGAFYRTALHPLLERINSYLVRWIRSKYRRLKPVKKALRAYYGATRAYPVMFRHWRWTPYAWRTG